MNPKEVEEFYNENMKHQLCEGIDFSYVDYLTRIAISKTKEYKKWKLKQFFKFKK